MLIDEVVKDGNIHVLPRIEIGKVTQYKGLIIAWLDGEVQVRHMVSGFLACRWAEQIAESRGVCSIKHFIEEVT